jgi:uncharacterized protein involved in type VI secretion and phage assembly
VSNLFRMPSELIEREQRHKIYGVVPAIVTNNKDPDGHYRIKVRFPWLPNGDESGGEESDWCRCATMGAGGDRGMFVLPEVGDEVLVAFEHGDIGRPFIIGSLWNSHSDNKTHLDNKDGKNNKRTFKSRSGHMLQFDDDKDGKKEQILLKSSTGAKICIDDTDSKKKIEIYDDEGNNYILIDNQNKKIIVESKTGDILLKAKEKITLDCKEINLKSSQDTKVQAGANFNLKASSNMELKASSSGTLESGSTMTIKGSKVNIN